ncbi:MAG: VIT1/CCC1 transporter family protein [Chloroflexi bacterium]|nr:VIT1/CCC1 transporter family protein [Chloroflexota bacterium]
MVQGTTKNMSDNSKIIASVRDAWRTEIASARMYRELARRAGDTQRDILIRLAEAEEKHAETFAARLQAMGATPGEYRESFIERARRWVLLQAGLDTALRQMEAGEADASSAYADLFAASKTDQERAVVRAIDIEERAHEKILSEMGQPTAPQMRLDTILKTERWHVRGGGWIGQAIYGMNDGLGAAFGVVSGVAGATNVNAQFVLLSGIATAIASALSMGSGAYLATKSEREVYEAEMERERQEIETDPEQEREEMQLFYELKGFKTAEAKMLAARLAEQPENLLKTLAHEELGLSEATFPDPLRSALSATLATALGAFIPVVPFFFLSGTTALVVSFVVSTAAHFVVGASKVIVNGRSWVKIGTEMTLVGLAAAIITYVIGVLIAPVVGG